MNKKAIRMLLVLIISIFMNGCVTRTDSLDTQVIDSTHTPAEATAAQSTNDKTDLLSEIPEYSGKGYVEINGNRPSFPDKDKNYKAFEKYSKLDSLGRCGVAYANICKEIMPTEKRGDISSIHPTGWDNTLGQYNRCHLIGYQLAGENANELNLITGTRYLNVDGGMLPFENMIADYIRETDNHVLYRVTPVFRDDELVCRGVQMEAYSVEDGGDGIEFNVYCYNVQPGYTIDYSTGRMTNNVKSSTDEKKASAANTSGRSSESNTSQKAARYILNTGTSKFHLEDCRYAEKIGISNRSISTQSREELIKEGYEPCKVCNP